MNYQKILFILKKRKLYDAPYTETMSSGLFNSAFFVSDMLNKHGVESKLVQVDDNNGIDREVSLYKPTTVVIEALWVVPEKFAVLHKLHPNVNWVIRLHSEIPFIANEGVAMEWIYKYSNYAEDYNLTLAPNTFKMFNDLEGIGIKNLIFLPNYYPVTGGNHCHEESEEFINIGCFGAIRPMKNQLIQAISSIEFGNKIGKPIHFHINGERIERGDGALKNIRSLFENQTIHKLVEHPWYNHHEFIRLIDTMDMGLQVSFNETFNIVAADFVNQNIPIIGSHEIEWLNHFYKAKPTSTKDIVSKMRLAYFLKKFNFQRINKKNLIEFSQKSEHIWLKHFKNH